MSNVCPSCGKVNRLGARFCAACRYNLTVPQPAAAGDSVRQAAAQAMGAMTPAARAAAQRGWALSKKGMSGFARLVTLGGRAAYSEFFAPQPMAEGQATTHPQEDSVPTPVEMGAFFFVAVLFLGWLVFLLPAWYYIALAFAGLGLLLLAVNFLGLRRPFFTRMTFARLFRRSRQVPQLRFQMQDQLTGGPLNVVIVGSRLGGTVGAGNLVRAYGVFDRGRNELRAWKVEVFSPQGQYAGTVKAPRLVPLPAALLLPLALYVLGWLGWLIGGWIVKLISTPPAPGGTTP
jgi:hypothetical protein